MDCAAWSRADPAIRATTAAARAIAMPPTIKGPYGAGFWDPLYWRIFGFTATRPKQRASWSHWGSRSTCTGWAPWARSSKAKLPLHLMDVLRRAGRWGKFCAPCSKFREAVGHEARLAQDCGGFVELNQHFSGSPRRH